jgi:hypothetical protein
LHLRQCVIAIGLLENRGLQPIYGFTADFAVYPAAAWLRRVTASRWALSYSGFAWHHRLG